MAKRTPQQQATASATIPGRVTQKTGSLASGALMRVLCLLVILALSSAEEVFHRRYHEDQSVLNPPVHKMIIRNKDQALAYLEEYGYLRCGDSSVATTTSSTRASSVLGELVEGSQERRHKRKAGGLLELLTPQEEEDEPVHVQCTVSQIAQAVRQFQKSYQIEQTAMLDRRTILAMNQNRCGNTDAALEDGTKTFEKAAQKARPRPPTRGTRRRRRALDILDRKEEFRIREARSIDNLLRAGMLHHLIRDGGNPHKTQSIQRRRELFKEYKEKIEREPEPSTSTSSKHANVVIDGVMDEDKLEHIRKKRSAEEGEDAFIVNSKAFKKHAVTWRLLTSSLSRHIPTSDQRSTLQLAFRMWSEVIPITFEENTEDHLSMIDIRIAFVKGRHLNCAKNFDGFGGSIAHSWMHGDIHFDDEENYKGTQLENGGLLSNKAYDEVLLLKVAVHEIGHVLGLDHNSRDYSVMFAIYNPLPPLPSEGEFELGWEDRKYVQNIYGCCKGKFDTIFDWVRPMASGALVYNTYLFRESVYWLYENRYNRTRYGDPQMIQTGWSGVPDKVDSFAQVVYTFTSHNRTSRSYILEAFFFQGDKYYKYDHVKDEVAKSYPRLISEDFGPMPSNSTGYAATLPNNIDSVFYHSITHELYFFKEDKVYVINYERYVHEYKETGCCDLIGNFTEVFPPAPNEENVLDGYITSVYYSYGETTLFFFKDEDVWEDVNFPKSPPMVRYLGKWYNKWFDICEA